ncbi:MAG: hypothetical protein RLZZ469_1788 [Bacteroidota bacterium]
MRKTLLTASLLSVFLFSCSNDDNTSNKQLKLFTTSNTSGKVSVTDLAMATPMTYSFTVASTDADGAYYFSDSDEFILASRSNNKIELYDGISTAIMNNTTSLPLTFASASDFNNAREIAVYGDKVVVTQDQNAANSNTNKLLVYQKTDSGFMLLNTFTVDFKVWGIHLDGNTLYAVADLTSDVVVFNNFFANANGTIMPTKRVSIEGLVRTHGITYAKKTDTMVLTDVGSATSDSDGGVIVIKNFSSVLANTSNMGTIATANQLRIYGSATMLGNPLDVAYDSSSKKIYVAERLFGGGKVLTFDLPTANVNAAPVASRDEPGVSSVFLLRE